MPYQAKGLLLLTLFFQCQSGYSSRDNSLDIDDKLFSRQARAPSPGLELLRLGKRHDIFSSLDLQRDPDKATIERSLHNLEEPVISESHLQAITELQEDKGEDATDEIYREMLGYLPGDTHFNYVTSSNEVGFKKRQLPMLRLGKRPDKQGTQDTEDHISLNMLQHGREYLARTDSREAGEGNLRLTRYLEGQKIKPILNTFRLGKRQLPMLRLGKRQLPMLRLGKRQLPMLRLGKRQLPVLLLSDRDGKPESLGVLPFDTSDLELIR
ncbi:hypothetical protein BsWGS_07838 [Bradybaena similaris]